MFSYVSLFHFKVLFYVQSEIEGLTAKLDDMIEFEEQTENAFKDLKHKEQQIGDLESKIERKTKQLHETEGRLADTLNKVEDLETKVKSNVEL